MRSTLGVITFIAILLLLDLYVFQAIKSVSSQASSKTKFFINTSYWVITFLLIIGFLIYIFTDPNFLPKIVRTYFFAILIGLFLAKLTAVLFLAIDDLRRGVQWLAQNFFSKPPKVSTLAVEGISRSVFLSWAGLAAGGGLFGSLLYGFGNKYNYDVKKVPLRFDNLPTGFKGLKILQISDIHSGSFTDIKAVQHGVEMIMKEKVDLILFTGDLVNNLSSEMEPYIHLFSLLKAPLGVYSILGNHDYGDYINWPQNGLTKTDNLEKLKKIHSIMGWRLLMNEHVVLEKGGDEIALIGVGNWSSKARFPKYGKLDLAHAGTEKYPFKILLSHDPSHWEAQVLKEYPSVDLMLSGHTHGMQFGISIPGFNWSPVQYVYKQWCGLYLSGKQQLYVNPGFGFIGYPGRVGILPEITVLELS